EAALKARRIGLGIMGLADLMYHVDVRYGSQEGLQFGSQVMEFVRYHAMNTSIKLAKSRGSFPAIQGSIYDPVDVKWQPPISLVEITNDWDRPELDWNAILTGISQYGIRNAAQTTVAPTGTIATVAGCEGYGCEPVFALAYIRHVNDNGKDLQLTYASPRFEAALAQAGLDADTRQSVIEKVMQNGSCQGVDEVPQEIRNTFVVSADITAEEHVYTQAALQAFVDNSLSKTVNFPQDATAEDVSKVYMLAWELGCKGITVYVTGSRENVVLETHETALKKEVISDGKIYQPALYLVEDHDISKDEIATQLAGWQKMKKPRPRELVGRTFSVETPLGKAFVTINQNGGENPFEVFINTAKAGSETAAVSEAIGRLISYILRLASPIPPRTRLAEVVNQLSGIGGGRSLGFGPYRVRSLPDGVGQVLNEYLNENSSNPSSVKQIDGTDTSTSTISLSSNDMEPILPRMGDLCPECGEATMVNEEGCRKCYSCGFSEC
ncbi:MAG: ribonucleoside-diphosphate reductase, adenosylcobalamin-dependent, partial [Anaerolineales bacterium]